MTAAEESIAQAMAYDIIVILKLLLIIVYSVMTIIISDDRQWSDVFQYHDSSVTDDGKQPEWRRKPILMMMTLT